jgi:hypothetical protein
MKLTDPFLLKSLSSDLFASPTYVLKQDFSIHLKEKSLEYVQLLQKMPYQAYVWFMHEMWIDRNLDARLEPNLRRTREPNVFNDEEMGGRCQDKDYINRCVSSYQDMLGYLLRGENLLTPQRLIEMWLRHFPTDMGKLKPINMLMYYSYTCMAPDYVEARDSLMNELRLHSTHYPNNYVLLDLLEKKYPKLKEIYLEQDVGTKFARDVGGRVSLQKLFEDIRGELATLIKNFQEKLSQKEKSPHAIYSAILDFTTDFEFRHFFPDANGRMRILLDHYLCLREGLFPLLPYNTASIGLDWMTLNEAGQKLILEESLLSMEYLLDCIHQQREYQPQWRLPTDMTQVNVFKKYLKEK